MKKKPGDLMGADLNPPHVSMAQKRRQEKLKKEGTKPMEAEFTHDLENETMRGLADLIARDWGKVNYAAAPYLDAMQHITWEPGRGFSDYYSDSGSGIVRYFLANAGSWRGPNAHRIKAELKRRLGVK